MAPAMLHQTERPQFHRYSSILGQIVKLPIMLLGYSYTAIIDPKANHDPKFDSKLLEPNKKATNLCYC